jgi:hypothetical protein
MSKDGLVKLANRRRYHDTILGNRSQHTAKFGSKLRFNLPVFGPNFGVKPCRINGSAEDYQPNALRKPRGREYSLFVVCGVIF